MKKKGFTLIELLAVIVILSVIALIATPIILNIVNDAKRSAFKNSVYNVVTAAENYIIYEESKENEIDWKTNKITNEKYISFNLSKEEDIKKLDIKGNVPKKGRVEITETGQTFVIAIEDNLCAKKEYKETVVNLLSLKQDNICLLTNNSSDLSSEDANDIISTITKLSSRVEELENKSTNLEKENQELKDTIEDMNNKGIGTENALNKIYPVGSIYVTTTLNTKEKVKEAIGGEWENYGDGKVLRGTTGTSEETGGSSSVSLTTANLPSHSHSISHTHTTPRITIASSGAHTHSTTATNVAITRGLTAQSAGAHTHGIGWNANAGSGNNQPHIAGVDRSSTATDIINSAGAHTHNVTGTITIPALSVASSGAHTHNVQAMTTNSQSTTTSGDVGTNTSFSILDPYITVYMYKRVK